MASSFVDWNAALLKAYFSPANAGEEVLLSAGRDELDDLAPELGGYDGLLRSVDAGPPWMANRTVATDAEKLQEQRKMRQRPAGYIEPAMIVGYGGQADRFPAYLPILAALVALKVECPAGEGYYAWSAAKVRRLRWDPHTGPAILRSINDLWDDLAAWTEKADGRYGRFRAARIGELANQGELTAQGVFRGRDAERIGIVFQAIGATPASRLRPEQQERALHEIRQRQAFSAGLRIASGRDAYHKLICDRLQDWLAEWDGYVPVVGPAAGGGDDRVEGEAQGGQVANAFSAELSIALTLTSGASLPWRLSWFFAPPSVEAAFDLSCNDVTWSVTFNGLAEVVASPSGSGSSSAILVDALAVAPDRVIVKSRMDSQAGPDFSFRHLPLRYLVRDPNAPILVEREAPPAQGPGYLLIAPCAGGQAARRLLDNQPIEYKEVDTNGLPGGWSLIHIPDLSVLAEIQLPDGRPTRAAPPPMRFIGGVSVRRASRRQYLPYDLPQIELDYPEVAGLEIKASGLHIVQAGVAALQVSGGLGLEASGLRRYRIEVDSQAGNLFQVELRSNGALLQSLRLRLADQGLGYNPRGNCPGLDAYGESTLSGPRLSGMSLVDCPPGDLAVRRATRPTTRQVHLLHAEIGAQLDYDDHITGNPIAKFLDSLAIGDASGLPYGVARDRLHGYISGQGGNADGVRISDVFRALSRRGSVELLTDVRGRWVRVAKVEPTIYPLEASMGGRQLWGVCGTLSFANWQALCRELGSSVRAKPNAFEFVPPLELPAIRIVGDPGSACHAGETSRFIKTTTGASDIVRFSADLGSYAARNVASYSQLNHRTASSVEYLSPFSSQWNRGQPGQLPTDQVLLRYTDPDTQVHKIRSLMQRGGNGSLPQYRHVRDERWATWTAYAAAVRWFGNVHATPGQWPLHYLRSREELWLPRAIELPFVLERALFACGGEAPMLQKVSRVDGNGGELAMRIATGGCVGPIDKMYDQLLPSQDCSWLQYTCVPPALLESIAQKLDCRIVDISRKDCP